MSYRVVGPRLPHVLRRGIADPKSPGTLYDGFAIDYGCYADLNSRPRDRGGWLNSPKGVSPDELNRVREAINMAKLE